MSHISIHWGELLEVAIVSVTASLGMVIVFTIGVLGLDRAASSRTGRFDSRRASGYLLAGGAFAICTAVVGYGLYLLIPMFH